MFLMRNFDVSLEYEDVGSGTPPRTLQMGLIILLVMGRAEY